MKIDSDFLPALGHLDLAALDAGADVVYFLDVALLLRGYNKAWEAFALANGGAAVLHQYGIGRCVLDASPERLRPIYRAAYLGAIGSQQHIDRDFQCSSAGEFRLYHQTAYPLPDKLGMMLTNHLVVARPHTDEPMAFTREYQNEQGVVVQCSHCRKLRHSSTPERWDWVPSAVKHPLPALSHGLCPYCLDHYYPEPNTDEASRRIA